MGPDLESDPHCHPVDKLSTASLVLRVAVDKPTDVSCPRSIAVVTLSRLVLSAFHATENVMDASASLTIAPVSLMNASEWLTIAPVSLMNASESPIQGRPWQASEVSAVTNDVRARAHDATRRMSRMG